VTIEFRKSIHCKIKKRNKIAEESKIRERKNTEIIESEGEEKTEKRHDGWMVKGCVYECMSSSS